MTVTDNPSGKPSGFVQLWGRDGDLIANLHVADAHTMLRLRSAPESRYFCLNSGAAIRIFDRDGRALGTLEGPRGIHARDVAIRADGALIAGLFADGLVRIWDVRGRRRSMTLAVGEAVMLLFGANPSRLLAASPDGVIEQYALDIADLFPAAARRAGRELTTEEIARFAIQPPVQLDLSRYA